MKAYWVVQLDPPAGENGRGLLVMARTGRHAIRCVVEMTKSGDRLGPLKAVTATSAEIAKYGPVPPSPGDIQ